MLDLLSGFVHELRAAGLPVSMTENLDAMRALEYVPLDDRAAFKTALSATLVKHADHAKVFDILFDVYFALQPFAGDDDDGGPGGRAGGGVPVPGSIRGGGGGGGAGAWRGGRPVPGPRGRWPAGGRPSRRGRHA